MLTPHFAHSLHKAEIETLLIKGYNHDLRSAIEQTTLPRRLGMSGLIRHSQ